MDDQSTDDESPSPPQTARPAHLAPRPDRQYFRQGEPVRATSRDSPRHGVASRMGGKTVSRGDAEARRELDGVEK